MVVFNFLFNLVCEFFNIYTKEVNVFVVEDINPEFCSGLGHFIDRHGNVKKIYFGVDKPEKLKRPSMYAMKSIFVQLAKLGYECRYVEINKENTHTMVYQPHTNFPVIVRIA